MLIVRSHIVYIKLKKSIIFRNLIDGYSICIESAAKELHCSTIPVREALIRLCAEDLVEHEPGRGFFIRPMTFINLESHYHLIFDLMRFAISRQRAYPRSTANVHFLQWLNEQKELDKEIKSSSDKYEELITQISKAICDPVTWSILSRLLEKTAYFRFQIHSERSDIDYNAGVLIDVMQHVRRSEYEIALNKVSYLENQRLKRIFLEYTKLESTHSLN